MGISKTYDVLVVGAGIIGLATAYAASQRGLRVAVVERNARCIGASVRNFGFVTITGQRRGEHWRRARYTRDVWERVATEAGIPLIHRGMYLPAQRPEAAAVLEAFMTTEMSEGCRIISGSQAAREWPCLKDSRAVLHSPHEIRVESRDALPQLAQWLATSRGVDFFWNTPVLGIDLPEIRTPQGNLRANHCIVCPGHDLASLFPDVMHRAGISMCTLQMLRVKPSTPTRLPGAVMSDLSLMRYEGYADLPEATPLKKLLRAQQSDYLEHGIHLIAVQSADGSLIVGDSHVYSDSERPFSRSDIEELILEEMHRVLDLPGAMIQERWTGTYASAQEPVFKQVMTPGLVVGVVTGGTGASIAFAFGEELLNLALEE